MMKHSATRRITGIMIARLENWKKASKGFTGDTEKPLWLFRKKFRTSKDWLRNSAL